MTKLILVRHGETDWNRQKRVQGNKDIPLSRVGLKQAKLLAKRLVKEKIDVIYSSNLRRAIDTAKEIAKYHNLKIIKSQKLNEMRYGVFEGLTRNEIKEKYPVLWANIRRDPFDFRIPKGESRIEHKKRVLPFVRRIIKQNPSKTIVIVSHNGTNRIIMGSLLEWKRKDAYSIKFSNTSINILEIKGGNVELKLFNRRTNL